MHLLAKYQTFQLSYYSIFFLLFLNQSSEIFFYLQKAETKDKLKVFGPETRTSFAASFFCPRKQSIVISAINQLLLFIQADVSILFKQAKKLQLVTQLA